MSHEQKANVDRLRREAFGQQEVLLLSLPRCPAALLQEAANIRDL